MFMDQLGFTRENADYIILNWSTLVFAQEAFCNNAWLSTLHTLILWSFAPNLASDFKDTGEFFDRLSEGNII